METKKLNYFAKVLFIAFLTVNFSLLPSLLGGVGGGLLTGGAGVGYAQIGINTTGNPPNASSMLDVAADGTTKGGLLIPRIALTGPNDGTTISNPATSLLVYNTNTAGGLTPGYYYNAGTPASPNWVRLLNSGSPSDAWLTLGNAGTNSGLHFIGTTGNSSLRFRTNNVHRMVIDSVGNVGIAVENPIEQLTLPYTSLTGAILPQPHFPFTSKMAMSSPYGIYLLDNSDYIGMLLKNEGSDRSDGVIYWGDNTTDNLRFMHSNWDGTKGILTDYMIITGSGNVGIGTISPSVKLEIAAGNNAEFIRLNNSTTQPFRILFGNNLAGVSNSDGVVYFEVAGNETYVMGGHLVSDDNLNRDLGSSDHMWRNLYVDNVYVNSVSDWVSNLWNSDKRFKKDIEPINSALSNVLKLKPVKYSWKTEEFPDKHFDHRRHIGLIAQEVEEVYPEIVNTNNEGFKSIDYSKLAPVLIQAIKEQQKIIQQLQQENTQIKQENTQIKQENTQTKSELKALAEQVNVLINTLSAENKVGKK
jgi:hypothetical protein